MLPHHVTAQKSKTPSTNLDNSFPRSPTSQVQQRVPEQVAHHESRFGREGTWMSMMNTVPSPRILAADRFPGSRRRRRQFFPDRPTDRPTEARMQVFATGRCAQANNAQQRGWRSTVFGRVAVVVLLWPRYASKHWCSSMKWSSRLGANPSISLDHAQVVPNLPSDPGKRSWQQSGNTGIHRFQ